MSIYESLEINGLDEIVRAGMVMIDNAVEMVITKHEFDIEMEIAKEAEKARELNRIDQQFRNDYEMYRRRLELRDMKLSEQQRYYAGLQGTLGHQEIGTRQSSSYSDPFLSLPYDPSRLL